MNALLRRLSLAALLSVVCIGSLALDAAAQQTKDITTRARESVTKGLAAQAAGRFDEAITAYNEAYALLPHPELLFNLGQAYRLKGDRVTALDFYRKYVAIQPDGRGAKEAVEWTAQIERSMREEAAAEEARRAEAARQAEKARQAEASRKAEEATRAKALQAEEQDEPSKRAPSAVPSMSSDVQERGFSKEKIAALAVGVAGATAIGVGLYYRDQSVEKADALREELRYIYSYRDSYQAQTLLRQATRYDSYEENLLLVGSSALAIGATLWVLSPSKEETSLRRKSASIGMGAIGALCLAASLHFWLDSKNDEYDPYGDIDTDNDIARNHAKGFGVVGGSLLAAGTYLFLSSSSRGTKPAKAAAGQLAPHFGDRSAGLVLSGQF
jgi:tetratricopeptide (TPR) repeat protein